MLAQVSTHRSGDGAGRWLQLIDLQRFRPLLEESSGPITIGAGKSNSSERGSRKKGEGKGASLRDEKDSYEKGEHYLSQLS
jgi:hypothetical protein